MTIRINQEVLIPRSSGERTKATVRRIEGDRAFCTWIIRIPINCLQASEKAHCIRFTDKVMGKWLNLSDLEEVH